MSKNPLTLVVSLVLAAFAFALPASAQGGASDSEIYSTTSGSLPPPACGSAVGPDVIVGDVSDVLNAAALSGMDAIALGTTSCNVGTGLLNWMSSTNDHPVIRQNLYRYKIVGGAGRFEQVGLSWLKHASFALQGSLCCSCASGGDGSHLGIGCSDPYGSGLNGSQSGLGPNWEVNAHTGVFAFPHANPAHGTDAIYRRCQVPVSDLELTAGGTTRYFGECQYVSKDDATFGNQNNNASWREMTCAGGPSDFTLAMLGTTQRGDPAIRVWAQIDAAVKLSNVQIPGDGLLVLGTRATDLGGGVWRYEYALYNMNADRNVGSFRVPVPAGVTLTNIGFHDVAYHDGDGPGNVNFAGTDWTATQSGGAITWACETEAQNASANALRWGTQYNFRFEANAAPVNGAIALGLWKTGGVPSMTGIGDVPGGGPATSFCFGDGTAGACPCANSGISGHGCANSAGTGGALLVAAGSASLSADTLQFASAGELPSALSIVLQGTAAIAPANFGDGLRCTGGTLLRLYSKNAVGGVVVVPQAGDPSISSRSATLGDTIPLGTTRNYQAYYRDASPSFCPDPPGSTFNVSNALAVVWGN